MVSIRKAVAGSFRDPSGYVYYNEEGEICRCVNRCYEVQYMHLMNSGLYETLTKRSLLVPHSEIGDGEGLNELKLIKPEQIPFVSYPYEWSFNQLKDAALITLDILSTSLEHGMILKDSSAFNIQFKGSTAIFIDTLSFEIYKEGLPWQGYKQFCEHFYGPLLLMKYRQVGLNKMLKIYIDGIPLDIVSRLLPPVTRFNFSSLAHIHFHAMGQRHYSDSQKIRKPATISKFKLEALISNLRSAILGLSWRDDNSEWGNYYRVNNNYTNESHSQKAGIVKKYLALAKPKMVWDIGANTGRYSRIASDMGCKTVAFDMDVFCVDSNYLHSKKSNERNLLPLVMDLTNPSGGLGWAHKERMALEDRGPADVVMALALIHHMAISNNLPFAKIAEYLQVLGNMLIIEFVPKDDSQVQRLLRYREDIFKNYNKESFEKTFGDYFDIIEVEELSEGHRTLYLMRSKVLL